VQTELRDGSRRRAWFVTLGASALLATTSLAACDQILGIVSLRDAGVVGASLRDSGAVGDAAPPSDDAAPSCADAAFGSDPHNCGACGHDCLGGRCSAGVCGAVVVAARQASPMFVAVNGGGVFWTTLGPSNQGAGALMGADVDAAVDASPIAADVNAPYSIVSGGDFIYADSVYGDFALPHSAFSNVVKVDPVNADLTSANTIQGVRPLGLAVSNAGLYWAGCTFFPPSFGVWQTTFVPTLATQALATESAGDAATGCGRGMGSIAVTQNFIFFSDVEGNVRRIQLGGCDGGSCSVIVAPATNPSLASDGTYIYWSDQNGGVINRELEDIQDAALPIAQGQLPGFVVVDDRYVYWSEEVDAGSIRYAPKDGGDGGGILAGGQLYPLGMALVDGGVYWVTQGSDGNGLNGTVMRIAKPL
jgi:hypothetical protein